MTPRSLAVLGAAAILVAAAHALPELPVHARGGRLWRELEAKRIAAEAEAGILRNTTVNIFNQLIWHNDTSKGTFPQRFFWDWSNFNGSAGSPIIFYISGEGPCGGSPGGYPAVLGKQWGALLVTMEHRYYGESLPAPLTDEATFRSLSVDTQMEDMAAFITYVNSVVGNDAGGSKYPVVTVGGSYAGALSAWFRVKHPELTTMSWSSSGVVNAVYNFTQFDEVIGIDVTPIGDCGAQVQAAMEMSAVAWEDPTTRAAMLAQFNTPAYFSQTDFSWMIADSVAMSSQYGGKEQFCAQMTNTGADALTNLATWTNEHFGSSFGSSCYYSTVCLSDPSYSDQWPNQRPWVFQCCTQLAYWQVYHGPTSMRSPLITLDYYDGQCQTAFGTKPNTTDFNDRYGGATPNATLVVALNGSDDPWQGATVSPPQTVAAGGAGGPDPLYPKDTAVCDGCGHCGDLHAPSQGQNPAITAQQDFIQVYLTTWLGQLAEVRRSSSA